MHPRIVGLVGPIRAGKSTVSQILADEFGYKKASNSELLGEILRGMNLPPTRDNLGMLGNSIFQVLGNDAFAHYRLRNISDQPIVVDGIRYIEEVAAYSSVPDFLLLAVDCAEVERHLRLERAANKVKDGATTSFQSFTQLATARSEANVPDLMRMAHHLIINNEGIAELRSKVIAAIR